MYGYYPPWYPMPPPNYGQTDMKQQDPVKAFKAWKKVLKEEKKEEKKGPPKGKLFTFLEVFMLCTLFSLPIGMLTSMLAVQGIKSWVTFMSNALK